MELIPKSEGKIIVRRGKEYDGLCKTASLVIKYVGGKTILSQLPIVPLDFVSAQDNGLRNERQSVTWKGKGSVSLTIPVPDYIWFRYCEYSLR